MKFMAMSLQALSKAESFEAQARELEAQQQRPEISDEMEVEKIHELEERLIDEVSEMVRQVTEPQPETKEEKIEDFEEKIEEKDTTEIIPTERPKTVDEPTTATEEPEEEPGEEVTKLDQPEEMKEEKEIPEDIKETFEEPKLRTIPQMEHKDLEDEIVKDTPEQQAETSQSEIYITSDMTTMATSLQTVTRANSWETKAREMNKYPLQKISPVSFAEPEKLAEETIKLQEEILVEKFEQETAEVTEKAQVTEDVEEETQKEQEATEETKMFSEAAGPGKEIHSEIQETFEKPPESKPTDLSTEQLEVEESIAPEEKPEPTEVEGLEAKEVKAAVTQDMKALTVDLQSITRARISETNAKELEAIQPKGETVEGEEEKSQEAQHDIELIEETKIIVDEQVHSFTEAVPVPTEVPDDESVEEPAIIQVTVPEVPETEKDVARVYKELDEFVSAVVSEDESVTEPATEEEPSRAAPQIITKAEPTAEEFTAEVLTESEEKIEIWSEVQTPVATTTTQTVQIAEVAKKAAITEEIPDRAAAAEPETTIYVTRDRKSMVSSLQAMAKASLAGTKLKEMEVDESPEDVTTVKTVPEQPPEGAVGEDRDIEAELLAAMDDVSETEVY